ncbi:unnamed protein product, partial [Mesorhabditis belari]|uniref:B30.2/SPRY domain-containing protein n=1 Tax=Mesorhabditis belari TaxID=2138241 RepID=A0AAF3FFX2_9BILA
MAPSKQSKKPAPIVELPQSVCYCDGLREVGSLEVFCSGCLKWYHGRCLRHLQGFYGLSFMVCYVFNCESCSPTKIESWTPKQANFIHMLVTVLANLTCERMKEIGKETAKALEKHIFFNLEDDIIPYFEKNWENLTSMPRRVKTTWHQTLQSTLAKQGDLFLTNPRDENSFALLELDLSKIGPVHEGVKQIGKKTPSTSNLNSTLVTAQATEKAEEVIDVGPKTRGAKRRTAEGSNPPSKKGKYGTDSVVVSIPGRPNPIDFCFNKDGYRYYLVERNPNVPEKELFDLELENSTMVKIHEFLYRITLYDTVMMSPNDRAYQIKLYDDNLTLAGYEGYCLSRATHSVAKGTWYFEVNFLKQPEDSHIRIGWSQPYAVLQACLGYSKYSYSWRSLKGTKFHEARGEKYHFGGFKQGDVLGCLIHLPHDNIHPEKSSSDYLPITHKDGFIVNFKHNYFAECQDSMTELKARKLDVLPGSRIEFFLNGKSCGDAFTDIYAGYYHPAISIFQGAQVQCNFGPKFRHPVKNARAMCERAEETQLEQSLSDLLYLVENEEERAKAADEIRRIQADLAI